MRLSEFLLICDYLGEIIIQLKLIVNPSTSSGTDNSRDVDLSRLEYQRILNQQKDVERFHEISLFMDKNNKEAGASSVPGVEYRIRIFDSVRTVFEDLSKGFRLNFD